MIPSLTKMATALRYAGLLVLTQSIVSSHGINPPPVQPTQGEPWPFPMSYKTTDNVNIIDAVNFRFTASAADCDILREAFVRYRGAIFGEFARYAHTRM